MDIKRLSIIIILSCLSHPAWTSCDHPGGYGNTPIAGSTVNCSGSTILTETFWTGTDDLTFNFSGTIDASAIDSLLRADTYQSGNTGWTANGLIINNNGTINASRSTAYLQGIVMGAGDQNNPDNGNMTFTNNGVMDYQNDRNYGAIYLIRQWSPTGAATINNNGDLRATASNGYAITAYQQQRGTINNSADANITATGLYPYAVIQNVGDAGWVSGSGYAPNYTSDEFTEHRIFSINNEGNITANTLAGGYGVGISVDYAQGSVINNKGTITTTTADATAEAITINYDTRYQRATADIRPQLSPYVINNEGSIQYLGSNPNGYAIYADGRTFEGATRTGTHADAFNPDIHIDNKGLIRGNITLADGDDLILLNSGSSTDGQINMAGGRDHLIIATISTLTTTGISGGGNSIIGDEIHDGQAWDDTLTFTNFVGTAPVLTNWEYIVLDNNSQVTLLDNTLAGQVNINTGAQLNFPEGNTLQSSVINNGHINIINNSANNTASHITGDLVHNGLLLVDANMRTKASDRLTVAGDLSGNGRIYINNIDTSSFDTYSDTTVGIAEAAEAASGTITIIQATTDADKSDENYSIALAQRYDGNHQLGRFNGSPFVWELQTAGNDWVLGYAADPRAAQPTPVVLAEIPIYTNLPTLGREIAIEHSNRLHIRLGELRHQTQEGTHYDQPSNAVWMRTHKDRYSYGNKNGFALDGSHTGFILGLDHQFETRHPEWDFFGGIYGAHQTASAHTNGLGSVINASTTGNGNINLWSIGGYATAMNQSGTYIDLVAQYGVSRANINAAGMAAKTQGNTALGSVEIGQSYRLDDHWIIEPQAQLTAARVNWHDFHDGTNFVNIDNHTYITGRAGVRTEKTIETNQGTIQPWAYVGLKHEFSDTPSVNYDNVSFNAQHYDTVGEIKLGITADITQNTHFYGDIGIASDFDDYQSVSGNLGIRIDF